MTKADIDELRKDRDYWRSKAKRWKWERDQLEIELANLRRKHAQEVRRAAQFNVFRVA